MATIEYFDHTADVGMRVEADTLDALFRAAAEGLFDYVVANREAVRPLESERVQLAAESASELLAAWLNELVYLAETTHRVFGRFAVAIADDGRSLDAEIAGEPIDPARHELDHEVKAVTRHGLTLEPKGSGWLAEMILDI